MVYLLVVYVIHIYVNLYCVHTYIHTVSIYIQYIHTVFFILGGYSAGLVLIVIRIMYSIAASMASD